MLISKLILFLFALFVAFLFRRIQDGEHKNILVRFVHGFSNVYIFSFAVLALSNYFEPEFKGGGWFSLNFDIVVGLFYGAARAFKYDGGGDDDGFYIDVD